MNIRFILNRVCKIIIGKKGIYCKVGKFNHFAKGVLLYESASIGNYNYFAPYTIGNNVIIGNYCSIGPGCRLGLGEHDMKAISMRPIVANGEGKMNLFDYNNPTVIGNDVWLGANVIIRQGVKIGNGAVVGANSLVLSDVPDYAVVYGTPAKIKKYRFDEQAIKKINDSEWYKYNLDEAKLIVKRLFEERDK